MKRIQVKQIPSTFPIDVEVLEHDCYEADDYHVEEFTFYRPTPQQIDEGTDRDEVGTMAVCNICGVDMPNIDPIEDEEPDYE